MTFISFDINLNMSDPLTLGMGHPVTERIRRLKMRKSNLLTRSGTAALILVMLGVTAPVFSTATAEPILEAVIKPVLNTESFTEKKRAETLPPETARKDLQAASVNLNFMNRYQVSISRTGEGLVEISKGNGGWPGYPLLNTDWIKRPLSAEMKAGLKAAITRCAASKAPVYFMTTTSRGDEDIGKGTFEVECVPGSEKKRAKYNKIDLAEAYLNSESLPLDKRHSEINWRMPFALFETYVKTNPNATIADDRAECVRIYSLMKTEYGFTDNIIKSANYQLGTCVTKDYNWVRKRENIPEVQ